MSAGRRGVKRERMEVDCFDFTQAGDICWNSRQPSGLCKKVKNIPGSTDRYIFCLEEIACQHEYLERKQIYQTGEDLGKTLDRQY